MVDDTTLENRSKPAEGDKKIAAKDPHNFWQNDEDYGATDTRTSLFAKELTEDQLLKDPRWIKASREIYKLNNKGDEAALAKLDTMSDAEIAQEGLSYYGQFNYNMAKMGWETTQFINNATPEQKKAMLFMMDAYDHKGWTKEGVGRALMGIGSDPLNLVGLSTFGIGVAPKMAAQAAAKVAFKETLKKFVAAGLTAEVKTELKNHAVVKVVTTGATIGAIEGAVYAAGDDVLKQKIEMDTLAANGTLVNDFRRGKFSFSRLFEHAGYGAAFGGTIGGTAPVAISAIGKRLKSIFGFNASPAAPSSGLNGQNATPRPNSQTIQQVQPTTTQTQSTQKIPSGLSGNAPHTPDKSLFPNGVIPKEAIVGTGEKVTFNSDGSIKSVSPGNGATKTMPSAFLDDDGKGNYFLVHGFPQMAGGAPAPNQSISLPEFKTKYDWFKFRMKLDLSVNGLLKTFIGLPFRHFAPVTAMQMESRPIIRPVIGAVDKLFGLIDQNKTVNSSLKFRIKDFLFGDNAGRMEAVTDNIHADSLINKIKSLQDNILTELDTNANDPTTALVNVIDKIDAFGNTNAAELGHFASEIRTLRDHVNSKKYETTEDAPSVAIKYTWYAGKYGRTGMALEHKNALLQYLDDMAEMADDLQKGTNGKNGDTMYKMAEKILAKKDGLTTEIISDSVTGLSHAHFLANNAYTRLTGKWGVKAQDSKPANWQWRHALENSIQAGYYNVEHQKEFIRVHNDGKNVYLIKDNLEDPWQNNIYEFFLTKGEKDANGNVISINWGYGNNVGEFLGHLEKAYNVGLDHDVFSFLEDLYRRRQSWNTVGDPLATVPNSSDILKYYVANSRYNKGDDPRFKKWADDIVKLAQRYEVDSWGAKRESIIGLYHTQFNRQNIHFYATESYPGRYAKRYPYGDDFSIPGNNYIINRYLKTPAFRLLAWFGGAHTSEMTINGNLKMHKPKIAFWDVDKDGKLAENRFMLLPRALTRMAAPFIIDDITQIGKPGRWLTTPGKFGLGAAGLAWAGEEGYEYLTGENSDMDIARRLAEVPFDVSDLTLGTAVRAVGDSTNMPWFSNAHINGPWSRTVTNFLGDGGAPGQQDPTVNGTQTVTAPAQTPPAPPPAASGDQTSSGTLPIIPAPPTGGSGNGAQPPAGGGGTGASAAPTTTSTTTTAQDDAIRAEEEERTKLKNEAAQGPLSTEKSVRLAELEANRQEREEAKKRDAAQAKTGKDGKPEGAVMMPVDMRNQLEKDKAYIKESFIDNSPNNNIRDGILADIDSAIAGLGGDNPSAAAKDAALKQMAKINEIRTNYDNLNDAIFNLSKFEKFVNESGADKTTLDEIKDVRNHLIAGKVDPNYAVDALKYAKKFHDNHNWDETKYNSGKTLKTAWDGLKTTEFEDPNNPLYGTLNYAGNTVTSIFGAAINSGRTLWGDITSGKKGSGWQTAAKFGGGLVAAWAGMSFIGEWIDQTPGLNLPIVKQVLKLALFVGILMGGAKFMESFMDTKAAIQTDNAGKYVPSSYKNTKYNIEAEAGNKPASSSRSNSVIELSSASTQSHRGGTPTAMLTNPEQNAVAQALIENARDASGSGSQGSGTHVAHREIDSTYIKMGTGNHFPVKDPRLAQGALTFEQTPHNDNADGTPLEKVVVLAGLRTPGYAPAAPTMDMR